MAAESLGHQHDPRLLNWLSPTVPHDRALPRQNRLGAASTILYLQSVDDSTGPASAKQIHHRYATLRRRRAVSEDSCCGLRACDGSGLPQITCEHVTM